MATKVLWYQRPRFLFFFSIIVSIVMIATTYSWSDLINQSEQEFIYYYQAKAAVGHVVISEPIEVHVTFKGAKRARQQLAQQTRREITHDMVELTVVGEHWIEIPTPKEGSRLKLVRMEPETVTVQVDTQISRPIDIRAVLQGEPAAGYQVRGESVAPQNITFLVPASFKSLAEIQTLPVSIRNLDAETTFDSVDLNLPDFVFLARGQKDKVSVTVQITPIRKIRLLDPIEVEVRGVPRGYTVVAHPSYISVQAQVPEGERDFGTLRARVEVGQLPVGEDGAIIEGIYPGYEVLEQERAGSAKKFVAVRGLPSWADNAQFSPATISLEVTAIPKEQPLGD